MFTETVKTSRRKEAIDITHLIEKYAKKIENGVIVVYVPHTTAGITINESYDPSVAEDMLDVLCRLVPYSKSYKHLEGNADAHIQATLVGSSVSIIVENSQMQLGRWQGVFFMEFDGPRTRKIYIKVLKGAEE